MTKKSSFNSRKITGSAGLLSHLNSVDQNCLNFHYKRVFFIHLARKLMLDDGNLTGMAFHALKSALQISNQLLPFIFLTYSAEHVFIELLIIPYYCSV